MIIKNDNTANVAAANLERALKAQEEASNVSTSPSLKGPTPINDLIALSLATNLVQLASTAGEASRLERILELKTAIQKKQYTVDANAVSHALIKAELLGQ